MMLLPQIAVVLDCPARVPRPCCARRSRRARGRRLLNACAFAALLCLVLPAGARGQAAEAQPPAHDAVAESGGHGEESSALSTVAKLTNFAILAGVLVYFFRTPIAAHLTSRSTQIREDLVTAASLRAEATAQLEAIERRIASLPAELDALKQRGADDLVAEKARIAEAAKAERERLLDQTRREIEMRLRIARRELAEHAAQLAVGVAEQRIRRAITPEDHLRLVDRYTAQLGEVR